MYAAENCGLSVFANSNCFNDESFLHFACSMSSILHLVLELVYVHCCKKHGYYNILPFFKTKYIVHREYGK